VAEVEHPFAAGHAQVKKAALLLDGGQKAVHELDRTNVAPELLTALGNEDAVTEYRVRQLIEEAISSSVLEGARPTTREIARQLVRENRTPASRDERMIMNNRRVMRRIVEIRDENRPLVLDDVLELHRIIGEDMLDVADAAGRFRQPEHDVRVIDVAWRTGRRKRNHLCPRSVSANSRKTFPCSGSSLKQTPP